ncbi:MAG: hypothetical protein ABSA83_18045 [Verrucomicrobiota bacterium]|jgi:hypothetical protein
MELKRRLIVWGMAAALCLCGASLFAQDDNGGGPGGPGDGGPGGPGGPGGGPDSVQFQQRMLSQIRQGLNVTNDTEWSAIQPLVQKVMDARRDADMGMRGPGGRGGFGPPPSIEQQTLRKALDARAPAGEIKDALAKFRAARKDKQARLEAAQTSLESVLTTKQEAQAVLMGLLE